MSAICHHHRNNYTSDQKMLKSKTKKSETETFQCCQMQKSNTSQDRKQVGKLTENCDKKANLKKGVRPCQGSQIGMGI